MPAYPPSTASGPGMVHGFFAAADDLRRGGRGGADGRRGAASGASPLPAEQTDDERDLLDGRTAVVTGASRGIGRGIARVFSQAGANVVLIARAPGRTRIASPSPGHPSARSRWPGTSPASRTCGGRSTTARERFGRLDVFCHNAGIYPRHAARGRQPRRVAPGDRHQSDQHLLAVQACRRRCASQKYGRIVLVSSITGVRVGYPGLSAYSATKAGMLGFMRTAALELAPFGITINGVEPGSIRTEGLAGLGEEAIASMIKHIPIGSLGRARGHRPHRPVPGHATGRGSSPARSWSSTAVRRSRRFPAEAT